MALEPIKWKSKIIMVKPETTYGSDATPTGAANAMLLTDVTLQPMEGEDISRNLERPHQGAQPTIPAGLNVVLTGSFELAGSGTLGLAPAWGPLIRACGVAQIVTPNTVPGEGKVEYVPITDGQESVSTYFYIGPTRHIILGGRATGVITMNAQGIPVCRVTITGLFAVPSDQVRPAINTAAFKTPQIATSQASAFAIGATSFVMRSYTLNLGCDVQKRFMVGSDRIVIVDKNEELMATVEAVPMATYNPYQKALDQTPQAVVLTHGTGAGYRVRIDVPQAEQKRLSGFENAQNVAEWPLAFTPLPTDAGNDQWKITVN